jgi:hypothetical protein
VLLDLLPAPALNFYQQHRQLSAQMEHCANKSWGVLQTRVPGLRGQDVQKVPAGPRGLLIVPHDMLVVFTARSTGSQYMYRHCRLLSLEMTQFSYKQSCIQRLSRSFSGHGDNFSKSYDETRILSERTREKGPREV